MQCIDLEIRLIHSIDSWFMWWDKNSKHELIVYPLIKLTENRLQFNFLLFISPTKGSASSFHEHKHQLTQTTISHQTGDVFSGSWNVCCLLWLLTASSDFLIQVTKKGKKEGTTTTSTHEKIRFFSISSHAAESAVTENLLHATDPNITIGEGNRLPHVLHNTNKRCLSLDSGSLFPVAYHVLNNFILLLSIT